MISKEGVLSLYCFGDRHLLCDLLLTPTLDDHVALLQGDGQIVDGVNHQFLRAFVHQVRLGENTLEKAGES